MKKPLSPKAHERRARFIEAAYAIFLEQGYERASMADIVRHSGGSLATLYRLFGNKEGLFIAMLESTASRYAGEFQSLIPDHTGDNLSRVLEGFGLKILEVSFDQDAIRMLRLAIGEGHKENGALGEIFYRHGVDPILQVLSQHLQRRHDAGELKVPDPALSAARFFHLVNEPHHFRMLITGKPPALNEQARRQIVCEATRLFIAAHQ